MTVRNVYPKQKWFVDVPTEAQPYFQNRGAKTIRTGNVQYSYDVPEKCIETHGFVVTGTGTGKTPGTD